MENKKKRNELSYNTQITVDHNSKIIVANAYEIYMWVTLNKLITR